MCDELLKFNSSLSDFYIFGRGKRGERSETLSFSTRPGWVGCRRIEPAPAGWVGREMMRDGKRARATARCAYYVYMYIGYSRLHMYIVSSSQSARRSLRTRRASSQSRWWSVGAGAGGLLPLLFGGRARFFPQMVGCKHAKAWKRRCFCNSGVRITLRTLGAEQFPELMDTQM